MLCAQRWPSGLTSSCSSVHEHPLALLSLCARDERGVRRRRRDVQARSLVEAHLFRHFDDSAPCHLDLFGVGALAGTEDAGLAGDEGAALRDGRGCRDNAGEFTAGDPGERRLVLVLALDLKDCE